MAVRRSVSVLSRPEAGSSNITNLAPVTSARANDVPMTVVLDTGSEMTMGNAALRAEIRRLAMWFDEKLYREVVEPLMNERMRKRLVSRESPDTRVLREAMRIANGHLDYVDYLLDHSRWLAGPGLSLAGLNLGASDRLLAPHVYGWGYSVNVHALGRRLGFLAA